MSSFLISQLQTDPRGQVGFNNITLGKRSSPVCCPWWQSPLHICPQAHPCCAPGQNSPPGSCLVWHFPVHGVTEQCVKSQWLCDNSTHYCWEELFHFCVSEFPACLLMWKTGLQDGKEGMCRAALPCGANIQETGGGWEPGNWISPLSPCPKLSVLVWEGQSCSFTFFFLLFAGRFCFWSCCGGLNEVFA